MRLIDADMLLQEINGFSMRITGSANAMALVIMDETKKSIMRMVDEQPIAYDVDKVVERLEKMRDTITHNIALNSQDDDIDSEILGEISHYQKIIQIVKSGGVD